MGVSGLPVIIGVDVGTTAVKCVAFGVGHSLCDVVSLDYPGAADWTTQDPGVIASTVLAALGASIDAQAGREILAVSLSTAMHGLVGLDASMTPTTPLLTWADTSGDALARTLHRDDRAVALHRATGTPVHPMSPMVKLGQLAADRSEALAKTVHWWGLKEWVLWQLTGQTAVDRSSASASGLLDVASGQWHDGALEVAAVHVDVLAPLVEVTDRFVVREELAARWGRDLTVVIGGGDGPMAHLGVAAGVAAAASLSVGTSAAFRASTTTPGIGDGSLFCYHALPGTYVVGRALSNGGSAVRSAIDLVLPGEGTRDEGAVLERAGRSPAGARGLHVSPEWVAERFPIWPEDLGASILGLRAHHDAGDVVRATVEGVCRNIAGMGRDVASQIPVERVLATGGVFRSSLWREVVAAHLPVPVHVVSDAGGAARGSALVAALAVGAADTVADADALVAGAQGLPAPVDVPDVLRHAYGTSTDPTTGGN